MAKVIVVKDDGTEETYDTFILVAVKDTGGGGDFRQVLAYDCRTLIVGAMLRKAMMFSGDKWDEFVKENLKPPYLDVPDTETLNGRIKRSMS